MTAEQIEDFIIHQMKMSHIYQPVMLKVILEAGGVDALKGRRCGPRVTWNRIPDGIRDAVVKMALDRSDLSLC